MSAVSAPRTVLAWLPIYWSRVCFPGWVTDSRKHSVLAWLILLLLPGVLLYPCRSFYLFEPDEGRYAEIPREMLQRGEWIVPYLQGEPYLDKPPLLYWLVMLSYQAFGVSDTSARLPPALAVHGCILLLYGLGKRSVGSRAAFWGALLLTVMPGLMGAGRLLLLDGLLTFWTTLAVLSAFEAVRTERFLWPWWLLAAAACGLGVLTKGPIAIILLVPPLWLYLKLTRSPSAPRLTALWVFVAIVFLLALPWYVAVCQRLPEFARYFLWEHNVVRFVAPFDHQEPIWFYGPLILIGLLPATLLLFPFGRFLVSARPEIAERRCPALGFLLLAGVWPVFFFSLSGSKLPTYILPAYPPLALALGYWIANTSWHASKLWRGFFGFAIAFQAVAHFVLVPWYADYRSPSGKWNEIAGLCANRETPIVCYPRSANSIAFYLARDDVRTYRSKDIEQLRKDLSRRPRTIVIFTHRHSLAAFKETMPADLRLVDVTEFRLSPPDWLPPQWGKRVPTLLGETALGACAIAAVERRQAESGYASTVSESHRTCPDKYSRR